MKYTEEQKVYLKEIIPGKLISEIQKLFNIKFNSSVTERQIRYFKTNHKVPSGVVTRFNKGQTSWNKGKKGTHYSPATEFKKGNLPVNHKPVGSERIDSKDGYTLIKVAEPNKWRGKHNVLWERVNGPIPKGHVVTFKDRNKENITIENLMLITKQENLIMNQKGLYRTDPTITETGAIIAKLISKTHSKKRGKNDEK